MSAGLSRVLGDIVLERRRQLAKHGDEAHLPDGTGPDVLIPLGGIPMTEDLVTAAAADIAEWAKDRCQAATRNDGGDGSITYEHILTEEWAEVITEADPVKLRAELVQLITVGVAWVMNIDGREGNR